MAPVEVPKTDWLPVSRCSHSWRPSRTVKRRTVFGRAVENSTPPSIPSARSRHVFMSPGAIRLVWSVSGNAPSGASTEQCSVALSIVSQGSSVPSAPGRSRTMSCSTAYTRSGRQPRRSGAWTTCMPRSPITPISPQKRAMRFQLSGLARSRSLECRKLPSASIGCPSPPERIVWIASCAPGKKGISDEQRANTPGRSPSAATMRCAAARSMPNGFSPRKSLPASIAARYSCSWRWWGTAR